jgi:hypothetical protein
MMSPEHAQLAKKLGYRCDDQGRQEIKPGEWYYFPGSEFPPPYPKAPLLNRNMIDSIIDSKCVLIPTMRGLWDWARELWPDKFHGIAYNKFSKRHEAWFSNGDDMKAYDADTPEYALLYLIKEILG